MMTAKIMKTGWMTRVKVKTKIRETFVQTQCIKLSVSVIDKKLHWTQNKNNSNRIQSAGLLTTDHW